MVSSKILITGAGGFIGYNLCVALAKEGHRIIGVDLHYPESGLQLGKEPFEANIGDFRDTAKMEKWLLGVDYVVHLASAHLQISIDDAAYWDVNVHSLKPFLKLVQKACVKRFIHVSSVGVYGKLQELPADEETVCSPQSVYGETKLAGEREVLEFSRTSGLSATILRPAWVYGPYCPRTAKIYRALRKGRFVMIGKGENLRHPIYILDMIEAFKLAMTSQAAIGEALIIAGPNAITTNELVETYCEVMKIPLPKIRIPHWVGLILASGIEFLSSAMGKEPPISKRSLEFFDTNNAFDITKSRKLLEFEPRYSFEEGLSSTSDWLLSQA